MQGIQSDIASRRTTHKFRENIKEIANIIRGVCRTRVDEDMHFGTLVYRGDGGLRHESWKRLLASRAFKNARRYDIGIRVGGLGVGGLTMHHLSDND